MTVNLTVSGRFHYCNYVRHLSGTGLLRNFFYAAKRVDDAERFGGPVPEAMNLYVKEYLTHGHGKLFGSRFTDVAFPLYERVFERGVIRNLNPADVFHFMLHGSCRRILPHARRQGSLIVGEPVNSHPLLMQTLMAEEYDRLGIKRSSSLSANQKTMLEEIPLTDRLLVGSRFVKRSFVENGYDESKIDLIRYGVHAGRFNPPTDAERAGRDKRFRVICVAQISARKGHVYLLEAWKKLALPDAELLLVGRLFDDMRPTLARFAGLFRHIDHVPHDLLRKAYIDSDVFVLPTVEDGFAYVTAEALACGLPVVITPNAGSAELVEDGKNGFVVPVRDSDALATTLERLYRDRPLLDTLSTAAKQTQTLTSWESYAEKLKTLYGELSTIRAAPE